MSQLYYLAYGSNLHPLRLLERVPSAAFLFSFELEQYRLLFEKKGQDDSGKCNIRFTGRPDDKVHAAMYQLEAQHKPLLDAFEGLGEGYVEQAMQLEHQSQSYACFSYIAQPEYIETDLKPYHWYKSLVLLGAQYLEFPEDYIADIELVDSRQDFDALRQEEHKQLLSRIASYQSA